MKSRKMYANDNLDFADSDLRINSHNSHSSLLQAWVEVEGIPLSGVIISAIWRKLVGY